MIAPRRCRPGINAISYRGQKRCQDPFTLWLLERVLTPFLPPPLRLDTFSSSREQSLANSAHSHSPRPIETVQGCLASRVNQDSGDPPATRSRTFRAVGEFSDSSTSRAGIAGGSPKILRDHRSLPRAVRDGSEPPSRSAQPTPGEQQAPHLPRELPVLRWPSVVQRTDHCRGRRAIGRSWAKIPGAPGASGLPGTERKARGLPGTLGWQ